MVDGNHPTKLRIITWKVGSYVNLQLSEQRRTENMAKKIKKSKGRGRKPKATVSAKQEGTPYDRARAALRLKWEEDSNQNFCGNIGKSRKVLQEYVDALTQLKSYKKENLKKT